MCHSMYFFIIKYSLLWTSNRSVGCWRASRAQAETASPSRVGATHDNHHGCIRVLDRLTTNQDDMRYGRVMSRVRARSHS